MIHNDAPLVTRYTCQTVLHLALNLLPGEHALSPVPAIIDDRMGNGTNLVGFVTYFLLKPLSGNPCLFFAFICQGPPLIITKPVVNLAVLALRLSS